MLICCERIFNKLNYFFDSSRGRDVPHDFRDTMIAEFIEFERKAYGLQLDPAVIADMKYAMAAFVDECVMYSEWPYRMDWMGRSLQLYFFGEHLAGENFFKKLSELRQLGIVKIEVLEIYYLCLKVGFKGMYRLKGEEMLISLQAGLRSQIESLQQYDAQAVTSLGLPKDNIAKKISHKMSIRIISVITLGIILLIYIGYSIAIQYEAHRAITSIQYLTGDNQND